MVIWWKNHPEKHCDRFFDLLLYFSLDWLDFCLVPPLRRFWLKDTLNLFLISLPYTVEPRYNEPHYNEPPGIMNDILGPGESYSKLYGTEPCCNEPRYNCEFPVITNTIQKPKCKLYSDITNNMSSRKWSWMRNRWSILEEWQFLVNILFTQSKLYEFFQEHN